MGVLSRNGEDARFLKANAASAAQLGVAPAEMEGRSALELGLPPALVQGWLMSLEAAHQLGKPLDVRWQLAAGHGLRTFTTRLIPFTDGGEPMQHFGYINQDWTGAQDVALDDAAERERIAGALAAALTEEIEAPLEQLLGLIGVVADEVGALADTDPSLELEECGPRARLRDAPGATGASSGPRAARVPPAGALLAGSGRWRASACGARCGW